MKDGKVLILVTILFGILILFSLTSQQREKVCDWTETTPEELIGARWWQNTNTNKTVICPSVHPEYVTEECKTIAEMCE